MKKLLIAMTAAAVGTCAWADGEQTLLNETFTGWSLTGNTWWSYSADAAEGELTVVTQTADNPETEGTDETDVALSLNTGSKVLTGSFTSDDQPRAIGDGLYFKSTVTFKDPSDTLPELKDSDKFALVVLDNVESIDAGYTTTPATNLWVIAKYGESGQRAYQLDVEVDPTWLAAEHEIVVKAYNNVMANGNCAGFLVKVDNKDNDTVCTVVQSCAIVNGVIDYGTSCAYNWWKDGNSENLGYLGYPQDAILGAVQKRYTDATLILSNVPGSGTLASVDFQGQGVIDDVSLATTGSGFGTDSLALTVKADGVTLVDTANTLYFAKVGDKVTIKFMVNEGYELSSPTGLTAVDGVYTYVYTTTANNEEVTISAFLPKVSVVTGTDENGNPIVTKYGSLSEAISKVAASAELTLTGDIALTEAITIAKDITINLNGKKLSAVLNDTVKAMFTLNGATLTIVDSGNGILEVTGGDRSIARTANAAGLTIKNGTIDAKVAAAKVACTIEGGKFLKEANATITPATGYEAKEENGYWVVAPASTSNYPESDKLVDSGDATLSQDDKAAIEETFDAIANASDITDDDTAVTTYINTVYNGTVPATALIGANNVDISVKFSLPLMQEDPAVKIVAEAAEAGEAAAFTFQIKEGDAGNAVAIKAALAKVYEMIRYSADLNGLDAGVVDANNGNVECTISADKKSVKVSFKSGEGKPSKGFMKVKLR